jgi:hypothetical protein
MNNAPRTAGWSTSAHGGPTEPSSTELSALKRQLDECGESQGPLFGVQCVAETFTRTIANHFVTTVLVIVLFIAVGTLLAKA